MALFGDCPALFNSFGVLLEIVMRQGKFIPKNESIWNDPSANRVLNLIFEKLELIIPQPVFHQYNTNIFV